METLYFEIKINATAPKVYQSLMHQFQDWTSVFSPTSQCEGSWEQGTQMHFTSSEADGTSSGLISLVKENIPNELISLAHNGYSENGKMIFEGAQVELLKGAHENYSFQEENRITLLKVETDVLPDWKEYFIKTFPKALEKLKQICEI